MSYAVGTRVKDISGTGWTGVIVADFINAAGQTGSSWQPIPPGFPANYNAGLVRVFWDNANATVYVPSSSLEPI